MLNFRGILASLAVVAAVAQAHAVDSPSFSKEIQPLLDNYCYTCHSGNRPKEGVRIESYNDLVKGGRRKLVVAGDPDASRLVRMMTGRGKKMPPRNADRQPTEKEINLIKDWIKAGAKDDSEPDPKGSGSGSGSGSEKKGSGSEREREKGRKEKDDDR